MTLQPFLTNGSMLVETFQMKHAMGTVLKEWSLPATHQDWKLMLVLAVASTLLMTYLITSVQSAIALRSHKEHGKRPPILPYWIPFVGNLISYLWDGPRLAAKIVDTFGQSVPAGVRLGTVKLYFVGDPDQIHTLFKPTPAISSNQVVAIALHKVLGVPDNVLPLYAADDSGQLPKPMPGSKVLPENRIRSLHFRAAHQHLAGLNGLKLGERYMGLLSQKISADTSIGPEWVELPDLYLFIQDLVFPAGTESLYGSTILALHPTLTEDFWAFEKCIPTLLKGLPRWVTPNAYRKRDKMLEMIQDWHTFACERSDCSKTGPDDPEWEPYLGCKYVRARQSMFRGIEAMNAGGRAAEDLGLLFAVTANSVTAVFWTILEAYTRPDLLLRVIDIAQSAYDTRAQESESLKLGNHPLLQSIFAEVTRLRVVGIIPRHITGGDYQLGGWSFPNGSILALSSRTGAMNKDVWNAGTPEEPHPLEEFWEERFLIYPDKPNSGPLRKQKVVVSSEKQELAAPSLAQEKAPSEATFSLKGLNGAYIPFGGGPGICPGRFFARQEVVCTLARIALQYEIELRVEKGWQPRMDTAFFPIGTLPPAEKVPFRIRRRPAFWT